MFVCTSFITISIISMFAELKSLDPFHHLEILCSFIKVCSGSHWGSFIKLVLVASDGQHLYLHPVNAKCMIRQYGSLENGPEEIEARLVQMDQMSMTEEIRRRFRYLNHLPITCEFALCELALEPPTVSEATLDYYHGIVHLTLWMLLNAVS